MNMVTPYISQGHFDRAFAAPVPKKPDAWRYKLPGDLQWQYTEQTDVIMSCRIVEALTAGPTLEKFDGC